MRITTTYCEECKGKKEIADVDSGFKGVERHNVGCSLKPAITVRMDR